MFNFLRIFSWLLFTFGLVGFLAVAAGFAPEIGSAPAALGILATQVMVASALLYGFWLHRAGRLARKTLIYGGWALVAVLVIVGQIWVNLYEVKF